MHNNYFYELINNSFQKNKPFQSIIFSSHPNFKIDKYILYYINKLQNSQFTDFKQLNKQVNIQILGDNDSLNKDNLISSINDTFFTMNKNVKNILIIKNIENGSNQAINALLKYLETLANNIFVLITTNNKYKVLKTILSRSIIINFDQETTHEFDNYLSKLNTPLIHFYQTITNDIEIFNNLYSLETENILKDILKSINQSTSFINILITQMNVENSFLILQFLNYVFLNIYYLQNNVNENQIDKLITTKSPKNIINILNLINEYKTIINNNNYNFTIQKSAFILQLRNLYD
ncbi:hypothetical protein [Mycoplasma miroungirhinis]|uniref:DNA polymerase III subunit delta n=1 Tax=Mycoplasma miroungirhinis TaxID=754516 RepID=A0A6M4JDC2_9MOLU|nr:hypothetical protein [Mycoplasma miroungirhinis]QJR44069.1 hypothetical protein HLA92_01300 [Mycoplasma miroungirhinis]